MPSFFPIKVKDVYKETDDCSVITFDIPEDLKSEFKYHQGQHLTLKKDINGEDLRRSYSLCSSPVDDEYRCRTFWQAQCWFLVNLRVG